MALVSTHGSSEIKNLSRSINRALDSRDLPLTPIKPKRPTESRLSTKANAGDHPEYQRDKVTTTSTNANGTDAKRIEDTCNKRGGQEALEIISSFP
jgi:hypothetical protein